MTKASLTQVKEAVKVDSRGRIVLGERFKDKQYSIHLNSDGEIILTPVVVMPAKEAWLLKNSLSSEQKALKDYPKASGSIFKQK